MALDLTRYETLEEIQLAEGIYRKLRIIPWSIITVGLAGIVLSIVTGESPKDQIGGPFIIACMTGGVVTWIFMSMNDYVESRTASILHRRRILDDAINAEIGE